MTLILVITASLLGLAVYIMCLDLMARIEAVERKLQQLSVERSQRREMEIQSMYTEMENRLDPSFTLMKRLREFDD